MDLTAVLRTLIKVIKIYINYNIKIKTYFVEIRRNTKHTFGINTSDPGVQRPKHPLHVCIIVNCIVNKCISNIKK